MSQIDMCTIVFDILLYWWEPRLESFYHPFAAGIDLPHQGAMDSYDIHCISNADTAVLHYAIDMHILFLILKNSMHVVIVDFSLLSWPFFPSQDGGHITECNIDSSGWAEHNCLFMIFIFHRILLCFIAVWYLQSSSDSDGYGKMV